MSRLADAIAWSRWAALVAVAAAGCSDEVALCPSAAPPGPLAPLGDVRYVAHAFGSPHGLHQDQHYTESREAFEASYHNGFRAYEIDLVTLADGTVAALHDQNEQEYGVEGRTFADMTRADVEGLRWGGEYDVLFGEDVIQLVVEHPDIWLILDTKWDHEAIAARMVALAPDDSVRDRLVPHVVSQAHADALPGIYPFRERMLARYQWDGTDGEIEARMTALGIDDVMMWWDSRWNEGLQRAMDAAGYHVWVHTPAEPEQIEGFTARGVGVYTDGYIACGAGP